MISPPLHASVIVDGAPHLDTPDARHSLRAQARFFIRHTAPMLLLGNALALIALRIAVGGASPLDGAVLIVTAAWWPFQEWLLHKHVLHLKPRRLSLFFGRGRTIAFDPLFARAHRAHHQRPWIVEQTLLPPAIVWVLIPIQPLAWLLLLRSWPLALTAAVTYALCALLYEWTHYLCHSHYVPRGAYYRRIWKNHRLHHFKNEHHWFSFTVPHVDAVMGTDPPADSVATSPTARTLEG